MTILYTTLLCCSLLSLFQFRAFAFSPVKYPQFHGPSNAASNKHRLSPLSSSSSSSSSATQENTEDPLEELDQTRKKNLYQCLLRDLQIEGVPLLECDAAQAHILQAALWTTMAELSDQDEGQKVCLVLENIGVDALRTFVDDFLVLKTQTRLMDHLPELQRFSINVVGKGAGPAMVIETANKTSTGSSDTQFPNYQESKVNAAMKSFIGRLVVSEQLCPYTKSPCKAPEGLEALNVKPGQIGYRYCGFPDCCHVLSSFWNCICEMLSVPDTQLGSVVLSMPAIGDNNKPNDKDHARFSAMAELISRSLCLFRGDDVFETLHFYRNYDRDKVFPADSPAHGHLPPLDWLRPMLRQSGNFQEADNLSDNDLRLSNYQRRSPFAAVVIKRVGHFEVLAGSANEIIDLELDDGRIEKASGVPTYAKNAIQLAMAGEQTLSSGLDSEVEMGRS
ncbi:expressed unknown protein [Seminavis robusta]|uniref:Uncharacterized protein n=1 Tax=Seminavis robusta TaxID=568900 RepID=A0A9N8EZF1_9STRA|nr:expressed unknown protein [Seminavis robusta]|eukprot:Sro2012_g310920.1 n/a (449) ;mRNA; r:11488-12834